MLREVVMTRVEKSGGNVYADLGVADADEMLVKAKLASKIGEILAARGWSQMEAAEVLGLPQPKLSNMLRGHFRGISEAKMMDCLARLGRDVKIVIGKESKQLQAGRVDVVSA
jgi:predicted XRE-type DNA-binding protein